MRRGVTVIELLAVLALLFALLLPAVQYAREAARRTRCVSNLRQLGVAIHSYHDVHGMFPPGVASGLGMCVWIMPYIEQQPLFDRIEATPPSGLSRLAIENPVPLFQCPSDAGWPTRVNYAGNWGTDFTVNGFDGMFRPLLRASLFGRAMGPIRAADVRDGLSNTAALSEQRATNGSWERLRVIWEVPAGLPEGASRAEFLAACEAIDPLAQSGDFQTRGASWLAARGLGEGGYNHLLPPNRPSCRSPGGYVSGAITAGSSHSGGVNVVFADGHVGFTADGIDRRVWRAFGSRDGEEAF
jgi:prepilin-type processing-associated H-X9-DG protein